MVGFLIEPKAVDDNLTVLFDREYTRDVSDNDDPGEGGKNNQRYQMINPSTNEKVPVGNTIELDYGVVSMDENGIYTYDPFVNANGIDTFRYIMEDSAGNTSEANVIVTVDCASSQRSDSASSLNIMGMLCMIFTMGIVGLYYLRKEEEKK